MQLNKSHFRKEQARQRHQQKSECNQSRGGDLEQVLDSNPWMKLHSRSPPEVLDSKKARLEDLLENEPAKTVEDETEQNGPDRDEESRGPQHISSEFKPGKRTLRSRNIVPAARGESQSTIGGPGSPQSGQCPGLVRI